MSKRIPTTEELLRTIREEQADALQDQKRLLALFSDFAKGQLKPQQNQLRIFLECQGNTRILNLRNAPKQKQQTEYHRLIQEMVNDYGMQETVALEICGTFWRVVYDTPLPDDGFQVPSPQSKSEHTQKTSPQRTRKPVPPVSRPEFAISPEGVLMEYNGNARHVVIPDGVKEIGMWALWNNQNLESVTIPSGVTKIGTKAFYECKNLTSVSLPESLEWIGESAFSDCKKLARPKLPNKLTYIGKNAFSGCHYMDTSDEKFVFPGSLSEVDLECLSPFYPRVISVSSGTRVVKCPGDLAFARYLAIPDSVQRIEAKPSIFENIEDYQRVRILASDKWIQEHQRFFQENPNYTYPSAYAHGRYYRDGQWMEDVWKHYL